VRVFHRDAWAEPDEQERLMGDDLDERFRRWHAERRWHAARNEWYRQNPDADYRLEDLRERIAQRRAASGGSSVT
jgi:hypothetical protein